MSKPTVYLVVFAERFSHVTEGIFSTPEKAEVFRQKLIAQSEVQQQAGEADLETDFAELYEVHEWVVDELDAAFLEYSAIAGRGENGSHEITDLGEPQFTAAVSPNRFVHYMDGSVAEVAYGRTLAEAVAKLQAASASGEKVPRS